MLGDGGVVLNSHFYDINPSINRCLVNVDNRDLVCLLFVCLSIGVVFFVNEFCLSRKN
jgi:hypothetical protein